MSFGCHVTLSPPQGLECEINMKGATALMTVELDKEKGPQIRVVQNREPPSFLNLFNGKSFVFYRIVRFYYSINVYQ
jgi:hypothetical protein